MRRRAGLAGWLGDLSKMALEDALYGWCAGIVRGVQERVCWPGGRPRAASGKGRGVQWLI